MPLTWRNASPLASATSRKSGACSACVCAEVAAVAAVAAAVVVPAEAAGASFDFGPQDASNSAATHDPARRERQPQLIEPASCGGGTRALGSSAIGGDSWG